MYGSSVKTEPLTEEMISKLMTEASAAADLGTVQACRQALRGAHAWRQACADVINEARAAASDEIVQVVA